MRVACTGLTLDLSNAASGMSRSVRLKCWLQPWTFLCQSCSRGGDERSGVCRELERNPMRKALISGSGVATLFESSAPAGSSFFRVNGGPQSVEIELPTELMYRLYRLGQAYGMRQLRYLESGVRVVIGSVEMPSFVGDLHRLRRLLNDPELDPLLARLIEAVERAPGYASKSVAACCGEYFERAF
jgi:hypothetical protein